MNHDVFDVYHMLSIQSLKGFLSWVCDQRRGKGGRRRSGIGSISFLEIFWKQYSQVYKKDINDSIDSLIMTQSQNVSQWVFNSYFCVSFLL